MVKLLKRTCLYMLIWARCRQLPQRLNQCAIKKVVKHDHADAGQGQSIEKYFPEYLYKDIFDTKPLKTNRCSYTRTVDNDTESP